MLEILVTGADGQLGRSLRRFGEISHNRYTFTDLGELDITDEAAVEACFSDRQFDAVVNCAAYTNVERAEQEEDAAGRINRLAVRNLARAAAAGGTTLIHVSTDYVFDGRASTPYAEEDATGPLNAYGRTKLAGEKEIAASGCRALIFRTAWLYSEYGSNFLKTMLRLTAEKEHINVVADQIGTPTYAGDLALAIFSIIEGGYYAGREGTYHFTDEGACSWYDFAVEIALAAGHGQCRIEPCRTADYPTRARRPAYSLLDKTKVRRTFGIDIPHWRESMRYCVAGLMKNNGQ